MKPRMNVYLTTSKKSLKYAFPAIKSLFVNNQDSTIYLYIVSEDLEDSDVLYESQLANAYGHQIIILYFDENMAKEKIICGNKEHWPLGTLSCYWLFHSLLPDDVDRIIAIESDTVTLSSLNDYYQTNFQDSYVICPGAEHKPENHKKLMKRLGGETLTFVMSLYNVEKIRKDFTLNQILAVDERVAKEFGHSQQELTFGILFKEKIKYLPGKISCVEENRQSMMELGYDYIILCEKSCKILHFSSFKDKGKPWNPVCIMPGYYQWWNYAQESPYYKAYFEEQWKVYDKIQDEQDKIKRNITYKNILLVTLFLFMILCMAINYIWNKDIGQVLTIMFLLFASLMLSIFIRKFSLLIQAIEEK